MSERKNAVECVTTTAWLSATPERVWERLLFFEQIPGPPPFPLSWLLPLPVRVEGRRSQVDDEARCLYVEGHLVKRITAAIPNRLYAFDVIEQELTIGPGIRLEGGSYRLAETMGGTSVVLETRYCPRAPWRFLWRPLEAAVGHAFHRHLIAALRHELQSAPRHLRDSHTPAAAKTPAAAMSPNPIATRRP